MSITESTSTTRFELVAFDLYNHIHKGLRALLFDVTLLAGRTDPSDAAARAELRDRVASLASFLDSHAAHEDDNILPALQVHLPDLARAIEADHGALEPRIHGLVGTAAALADAPAADARRQAHELYLGLASFTADYLAHQQVEERVVMPALEAALGIDGVLAIHEAIITSIPPDEMAASLAMMLPVMNLDDSADLLGGMKAGAPAEVFQGVLGLAASVLPAAEHAKLVARLGA